MVVASAAPPQGDSVARRPRHRSAVAPPRPDADGQEIAEELDVELGEVTQALIASNAYQTNSLDTGGREDAEGAPQSLADTLGAEEPCYNLLEQAMAVRPLIAELPPRDRQVLIMRFYESRTQSQIAEQLGVSQMQVSRILARILGNLRERALGSDELASSAA